MLNDKQTAEMYYKALLTLLDKLERIKPGVGNSMPIVYESIGYIKGIVGQVEVPTSYSNERK